MERLGERARIRGIPEDSAAMIIGVAPQTLSSWRKRRVGPRWFRAGRLIRYRKDWLLAWIEQNASNQTPREEDPQ